MTTTTPAMPEPTQEQLDAFIKRAGFSYGWMNLESSARRMAERAVWEIEAAKLATLQAQPAGHDCVYHAVPLTPGDTLGPQTAACMTCGQPPSAAQGPSMTDKPPAMPEQVWLIYAKKKPELRRLSFSHRLSAEEKGSGWVAEAYALAALQSAQPAAAVSDAATDEQIAAGMRELFAGPKPWPSWEATLKRVYQAMSALRPQAVPMTPASRAVIMATRTADGDADEWPEPWAYRRGWNDAEAHHITAQGAQGEQG